MAKKKTAAEKQKETATNMLKGLKFSYDKNLENNYKSAYDNYINFYNNPEANGFNAYINDVNDLYDQVMNQEKFSYDPQKDQLFQMYKKQYQAQGNRAMQNQMGAAAANSGGYNSSAAQTSAQNTFQTYMNDLSQKASETYKNSLDMYKYNQQNLLDRYNVARDMNNSGNDAYWKQLDAKNQMQSNAYNLFQDDKTFNYTKFVNDRDYWTGRQDAAQTQINFDNDYAQTEKWSKKNYNLTKKGYTG